jgi:lysozyme
MLTGVAGTAVMALTGCAGSETSRALPTHVPLRQTPAATPPVAGLDAVIDISHLVDVTDFTLVRRHSNILGVLHKTSEGGDWVDPLYSSRRPQAEAAGLLWGAYHFGTRQYSGADQAAAFLAAAQPGPRTLMALDFEPNERHRDNSMDVAEAEAFVRAIYQATGRLPLVYTHPSWADGEVYGRTGMSLRQPVRPDSILAQCDLWLADYREQPEVPVAWSDRGWRLWQYAGNDGPDDAAYGSASHSVAGVDHCDRNLFAGDVAALHQFWIGRTVTS